VNMPTPHHVPRNMKGMKMEEQPGVRSAAAEPCTECVTGLRRPMTLAGLIMVRFDRTGGLVPISARLRNEGASVGVTKNSQSMSTLLKSVAWKLALLALSVPAAGAINLSVDAGQAARQPLNHYWSRCVGAGRANEGLRAAWLEHLQLAHDRCGFQYVRFHGLFHDDMFVYREERGKPAYNWQYIDEVFDRMLAIGVRPFVELGFTPAALASGDATVFWWKANVSPPKDYEKWAGLVEAFARHCVERYGLDEVRRWYFEVWNEPNLTPFWSGTRSQYFELYKASVLALRRVDQQLRVGGPATSNFVADGRFDGETAERSKIIALVKPEESEKHVWRPVWLREFLEYCAQEKLPVDFVSTHPYPTDWALDGDGRGRNLTRQVEATTNDLRLIRALVDASAYPKAEIHLTEWSSTPSSRDAGHDSLPAATYIVKANVESAGLVDSLSYWIFTDVFEEKGGGDTIFHGGFGLINFQGIPKPSFHAYRMLHALGDEVLATAPGVIATRHKTDGRITALAYHYPAEMPLTVPGGSRSVAARTERTGTPVEFSLNLSGLRPGARMLLETLDAGHGNALAAWQALGSPQTPSREQTAALRAAAFATQKEALAADAAGRLTVRRTLEPWTVLLITEESL